MNIDPAKEKFQIEVLTEQFRTLLGTLGMRGDRLSQYPGAATMLVSCCEYARTWRLGLPISPLSDPEDVFRRLTYHITGAMDLVRYSNMVPKARLADYAAHFELALLAGFGLAPTYFHLQSHADKVFNLALQHCSSKDKITTEILQDATRKGLELMFGLAAEGAFGNVKLEDPNNSGKGPPNPDLIVAYDGENYGVACKMVSSRNVSNFRRRIDEALGQVDRAVLAGKVDNRCGIVVLDISPLLNHEKLYVPRDGFVWEERDDLKVSDLFQEEFQLVIAEVFGVTQKMRFSELMGREFKDSYAAPCIMLYGHTVMLTDEEPGGAPKLLKRTHLLYSNDYSSVKPFVNRLSDAVQGQVRQE